MQFTITKTSINPIIVKKEPGTFTQIRNKEPVPGSRFPVPDYQFYINICSFHTNLTVFIICRQITFNL